jgi:hypothetical protein
MDANVLALIYTKLANRWLAGESACRQIVPWIDCVRLFRVGCSVLLGSRRILILAERCEENHAGYNYANCNGEKKFERPGTMLSF